MVWTCTLQQHGVGVKSKENRNKAECLQLFTISKILTISYGYSGKNTKRHSRAFCPTIISFFTFWSLNSNLTDQLKVPYYAKLSFIIQTVMYLFWVPVQTFSYTVYSCTNSVHSVSEHSCLFKTLLQNKRPRLLSFGPTHHVFQINTANVFVSTATSAWIEHFDTFKLYIYHRDLLCNV